MACTMAETVKVARASTKHKKSCEGSRAVHGIVRAYNSDPEQGVGRPRGGWLAGILATLGA